MSLLQNSNAISQLGGYNLTDSVRFRKSAIAYLERTPTTAGNRKTWTWSGWIKRADPNGLGYIWDAGPTGTRTRVLWMFRDTGKIRMDLYGVGFVESTAVFRDPSAWYHVVINTDTTLSSGRTKVYVNNELVLSSDLFNLNEDTPINNTGIHYIGRVTDNTANTFDGYMTEVNLVDGQALTPSDFGETDTTTGVWKPKEYTGTYGTNGFYLPMKATTQASGFNTVLYTGTGTDNLKVEGVGFSPDFVWIKSRDGARSHMLYDTVRGATNRLASESTTSELSISDGLKSFDTNGFTLGTHANNNTSGEKNVAWCWEAGGTAVSNTDGTITSSVSANTAKGFSVVTWTGNGLASQTVGHGLGIQPNLVITKRRSSTALTSNWIVGSTELAANEVIYLNTTGAATNPTVNHFDDTYPTTDVFSVNGNYTNQSGGDWVAYCFASVSGFSKIGSYTGNGSTTGPTVTTGFRPAFVMIKDTTSAYHWRIFDNTRSPSNPANKLLTASNNNVELTETNVNFTDTGFEITGETVYSNTSGNTYIYMAFADTRDAQFNFDASGNKNNFTPTNINSNASSETSYDIMSDVPTLTDEDTANYPTFNPVDKQTAGLATISDGNLKVSHSGTIWDPYRCSMSVSTGKWYWEVTIGTVGYTMVGVIDVNQGLLTQTFPGSSTYPSGTSFGYYFTGSKYGAGLTNASYGASYTNGDVIGVALDLDAGTITFYKNNVSQGVAFSSISGDFAPATGMYSTANHTINFGQQPFAYTPPTGYKKLNTYNLPDSAVVDGSQYFDAVTYTGTGSNQTISSVEFSPDLVWIKSRSATTNHRIYDTVRGSEYLVSNSTAAAVSSGTVALTSNGFIVGTDSDVNTSSATYVAWNWRGSDSSAVSNTVGSIASTVSANTTSGFSVVTYSGNNTAGATVGHGLGITPNFIAVKVRNVTGKWTCYHSDLGNTKYVEWSSTIAAATSSTVWNNTSPTSDVFSLGTYGNVNGNYNYVAYCFAEVEGFSKFGKYTGNASTDGPFVYTGFRPAFVLVKDISGAESWHLTDTTRDTYNLATKRLYPNGSDAETDHPTINVFDILSNGFKIRSSDNGLNGSGRTMIYMAFAENPFKNSLAR